MENLSDVIILPIQLKLIEQKKRRRRKHRENGMENVLKISLIKL